MSASSPHPSASRLLALLDGELSRRDADESQAHLVHCDRCRDAHEELLSVREMLSTDAGARPLRPVWPAVRERLAPRPRFTPTFAFGAALAALAGVFLGLALDSADPTSVSDSRDEDVWTGVGTSLGSDTGLYALYFGDIEETTP